MTENTSYDEGRERDYESLIETIDLPDSRKNFMRARWLDQVMWMEAACKKTQRWYYVLRLTAIVGGILVPALIGRGAAMAATVLSLVVAASVAVEEFFHFGERWRHYRQSVELLKIQAWHFFQMSGPYRSFRDHAAAYPAFAGKVEEILQNEVHVYISEVVKEKKEDPNTES